MIFRLLLLIGLVVAVTLLNLKPVVDSTWQAYKNICGGDQDFAYANHPTARLPVFAPVTTTDNETIQLKCFSASQFELLNIRAGFGTNDTLAALVDGSHPQCRDPSGPPPLGQST